MQLSASTFGGYSMRLLVIAAAAALACANSQAAPGVMLGFSYAFDGSPGISLQLLSSNSRDRAVVSGGVIYYPTQTTGRFGLTAGAGYTFNNGAGTIGYDFTNNRAAASLGIANTRNRNAPPLPPPPPPAPPPPAPAPPPPAPAPPAPAPAPPNPEAAPPIPPIVTGG